VFGKGPGSSECPLENPLPHPGRGVTCNSQICTLVEEEAPFQDTYRSIEKKIYCAGEGQQQFN
jgi:hypothetical protein